MLKLGLIRFIIRTAIAASVLFGIMELGAALVGHVLGNGELIVFGADGNIYLMDVDHFVYGKLEKLPAFNFAVSPDGQKIAFWDEDITNENHGIYLMDRYGTQLHQITRMQLGEGKLVWSPDSTQILFLEENPREAEVPGILTNALFLLDTDNGVRRQLTNDLNAYSSPTWSPDGKQIAIVTIGEKSPRLFILSAKDGKARLLATVEESTVSDLSWSSDGQSIQFIKTSLSNQTDYSYYTTDIDGRNQLQLLQSSTSYYELLQLLSGHDSSPVVDHNLMTDGYFSWSSDDEWIAYLAYFDKPQKNPGILSIQQLPTFNAIVISKPGGSYERILSTEFENISSPIFLPR